MKRRHAFVGPRKQRGFIINPYGFGGGGGSTPITFVASESGGVTGTTVTVNKPAGTVDGDFLVFFLFNSNQTQTLTTSPGGLTSTFADSSAQNGFRVFTKFAVSEGANYTFIFSGSQNTALIILTYRNVTAVGTVGAINRFNGTTATIPALSISPSNVGALLALYGNEEAAVASIVTPPAGMTQRATDLVSLRNVAVYDLIPSPSGATGNKTIVWGVATGSKAGLLIQLR